MSVVLAKWGQTILVSLSNLMVYKVNFLLQVIGPMFVFFVVKASLWTSVYASAQQPVIAGYDLGQMLAYHLWVLVVGILVFSASSQGLAEDIRLGRISTYLIYPFSLWEFHSAKFLARLGLQFLIAILTAFSAWLAFGDQLGSFDPAKLLAGSALCLMAAFFWHLVNYFMGLLAFWLEETWTLAVMAQIVTYFLSGSILPLELFPKDLTQVLQWLPFPYISFAPAKLLAGKAAIEAFPFLVLGFWSMILILLILWVWSRGLKLYSAAGM